MSKLRDDQETVEAEFSNARPRARFLFGDDVAKYVEDIFRRATEQATILRRAERVVGAMRPEDNVPHHANLAYFQDQASFGAREVFGPYLDFSEWH